MNQYRFGVTGQERKNLVTAISAALNLPKKYLGTPSYGFQVGNLTIDREGTVSGEMIFGLLTALAERGFIPEAVEEDAPENAAEPEVVAETPEAAIDSLCIEVPLDGFNPETIDNLCKMVLAKEALIKKALGADKIPIKMLQDRLAFPWFTVEHSENITAYAQFIAQLCKTAKEKKRVTAKPQEAFENEKFTMRVWLIGLGLIGKKYAQIRKLMTGNLNGNGAWRYGKPEAVEETAPAPETAAEAPADESAEDNAPEAEAANVADTDSNEGEVTGDE